MRLLKSICLLCVPVFPTAQRPITFFTKADAAQVAKDIRKYPVFNRSYIELKKQVDEWIGKDIDVQALNDANWLSKVNHNTDFMHSNEVKNIFIEDDFVPWEEIDKRVRRKVMAYDDNLMMVKVQFDKGGIGTVHQHSNSQISLVESGRFEIEINGFKKTLKAGDAFYIPPNVMHGAVCLEPGILVDVFSPMREEFIEKINYTTS